MQTLCCDIHLISIVGLQTFRIADMIHKDETIASTDLELNKMNYNLQHKDIGCTSLYPYVKT
jgi:hypothetical protein